MNADRENEMYVGGLTPDSDSYDSVFQNNISFENSSVRVHSSQCFKRD